jgi:hypothetical protein
VNMVDRLGLRAEDGQETEIDLRMPDKPRIAGDAPYGLRLQSTVSSIWH